MFRFLLERKYAPYAKWFGTAFSRLDCAQELAPVFDRVLASSLWREREEHLSEAYRLIAEKHNALGITRPLDTGVSRYHGRPYLVIHAELFVEEIRKAISDEEIKSIGPTIGSVNQFADSTDVADDLALCRKLLSDEHPDVANSLYELALLLAKKGDYAAAEPLFREAPVDRSTASTRAIFGELTR